MEHNNILSKIIDDYNVVINIVTIEELDSLKNNKNVEKAKKAQHAIRFVNKYKDRIVFSMNRTVHNSLISNSNVENNFNINDDIIVSCALAYQGYLITEDLNLKIKSSLLGVKCIDFDKNDKIYKGYIEYRFTPDEYNYFYENRSEYFPDMYINQYIIIRDKDSGEVLEEYRFNGEDLVKLKLPSSKIIKAENVLQRCALDMLNNNDIDICVLLGGYGSGKTYLSLRMALHSINNTGKQSKILGVREPVGEGREVGYLKGDFEDKTTKFFTPLIHSLDGGEYEFQSIINRGCLEVSVPYFMKGTTYNSTIIVCDEAEDFSEKQIRLIGTRLGKESRIFFSGDYNQGIFDSTTSNPLVKMCQELKGNPKFACIYLDEDVRSEASKIFANLYKL